MRAITIRPARPHEADALSALCKRAKAHWGYDAEFLRLSEASLTIGPALIGSGLVLVAEDARLLGLASLDPLGDGAWDLLHMFVEPGAMGRGVGRLLFAAIAALARQNGGATLSVLADPNAEAFYLRMGARRTGAAPSDAVPDRLLPLLQYDLAQS